VLFIALPYSDCSTSGDVVPNMVKSLVLGTSRWRITPVPMEIHQDGDIEVRDG